MLCIARLVYEANAAMFAPDYEGERHPDVLVHEPPTLDQHMLRDGRTWVRVYLDGSALTDQGRVIPLDMFAASKLRLGHLDLVEADLDLVA